MPRLSTPLLLPVLLACGALSQRFGGARRRDLHLGRLPRRAARPAHRARGRRELRHLPRGDGDAASAAGQATFKLTDAEPALCTGCHDALGAKAQVHAPVRDGSCTTCHAPHASNSAHLLLKPQKELCADCHSEPGAAAVPARPGRGRRLHRLPCAARVRQPAAPRPQWRRALRRLPCRRRRPRRGEEGRSTRRSTTAAPPVTGARRRAPEAPRRGGAGALLPVPRRRRREGPEGAGRARRARRREGLRLLPLAARGRPEGASPAEREGRPVSAATRSVVTPAMTVLHGPIRDGSCTACHEPHGGEQAERSSSRRSRRPPTCRTPTRPTRSASPATTGTCCKYPDTSFATGFRDGERNLHFLHVNNAQKGRSCVLCHELHGGTNDALIADSVPSAAGAAAQVRADRRTAAPAPPAATPGGLRPQEPGQEAVTDSPARGDCSGSCLARFPWVLALRKRAPGPWEPSVQPPLVGTSEREARGLAHDHCRLRASLRAVASACRRLRDTRSAGGRRRGRSGCSSPTASRCP